jgi:hypothetical protein
MSASFIWVQGASPPDKGKIVSIRDHHLSGWSYLVEGVTRPDIEKEFAEAYDFRGWPEAVLCQVTVMKDGKTTDRWEFKIDPPPMSDS